MKVPSTVNVVTAREKQNKFSLPHKHLTTTDFFRAQAVVCREMIPGDSFKVDITSFVRMFPMPFPVFGRIKYYNRVFYVPYRMIMEGFNQFITDTDYPTDTSYVRINSVPYFTNADICDCFKYDPARQYNMSEPIDTSVFYWRKLGDIEFMCNYEGKVVTFDNSNDQNSIGFVKNADGTLQLFDSSGVVYDYWQRALDSFGVTSQGTYTYTISSGVTAFDLVDSVNTKTYLYYQQGGAGTGEFQVASGYDYPAFSSVVYDQSKYDYTYNSNFYRFTNRGRRFYTLLCSLGYRVDFSSSGITWSNTQKFSAGKLLAWLKIMLDWYEPSQYQTSNDLQYLFHGVNSTGKHILDTDLYKISELEFTTYDRDYFTSAWNNPSAPNVGTSSINVEDYSVTNPGNASGQYDLRSMVRNTVGGSAGTANGVIGSLNQTPTLDGSVTSSNGSVTRSSTPFNISQYILDALQSLTNWMRRNQLSGYRTIDRYLAQYGKKLSDDRVARSYYIGGYSYDADIMDIMSTADTPQAALGDYAGKGIAYSDAHRDFNFESDEYGFFMVISSVVPEVGYVQGIMRENLHLDRMSFFQADFDNLGTQAIRRDELFADLGMPKVDGDGVATAVTTPDSVFGFSPRYMEYKVGYDFLTGDFNVPSRREGMDAYHLFRLFKDGNIASINKGFLYGEQKQYDRIFNNTDDNYDHMYVEHYCRIDAYRPMKSAQDVYEFRHAPGSEISIQSNGTQLN